MSLKSEIFSMINSFPNEFRKDEMVRTFIGGFDGLVKDDILQLIGITISNRFDTYVQWRGAGYGFCVVSDNHMVMKLLDDLLQHIKLKKHKSLK